ncbi:MAG: hypothetical protein L6R42_006429 [Xanthoria sp. 1 TBL-2021]|nr:MAG: hypothetical protein L6R42_006429 [Xanthoria sp. 1 TBL-2021]
MYCNNLVLLLLSVPFLTQAGPLSSVDETGGFSVNFSGRVTEPALGTLIARAGDDEARKDTKDYLRTGETNWKALLAKLKDDSAEDVDQHDGLLAADYSDVPTRDATPDSNAFKKLFQEDLHLDYTGRFAIHAVSSKRGGSEAFVNMFNTNQGTVVGVFNDKRVDDKQSMPFSEVVFQSYKAECDEIEELKKFQFFGVSNIGNTEYGIMIDDIYKRRGEKRFGEAANKWIKWTYDENQDDFLAFLGTPEVGFILRMLTDHSKAFGKKGSHSHLHQQVEEFCLCLDRSVQRLSRKAVRSCSGS